jgi:hypothetical protein
VAEQILTGWFGDVAKGLLTDVESLRRIEHRGAKGTAGEQLLAQKWLSKYVPQHLRVIMGGEAVDVDGTVSRQQDLMIVDPTTPPLFSVDSYLYLARLGVRAVGGDPGPDPNT